MPVTKRAFDMVVASFGLLLLSPLFLVVALLIKYDSPGPVFFRQDRIGRQFRPFLLCKFRTMVQDAHSMGASLTVSGDPRITRVGRFLRRTKIDELPQLINVLKGEMSVVGPRPEILQYLELYRQDYAELLTVRPGITDLASLKYRDEAAVLGRSRNPEEEYVQRILPDKIRLGKEYIRRSSLLFDLSIILRTILRLL